MQQAGRVIDSSMSRLFCQSYARRSFASLGRTATKPTLRSWHTSAIGSTFSWERDEQQDAISDSQLLRPIDHPHFQQVRWKRKVGARFVNETRKPSKKERRKYNRKIAAKIREENKHNPPGSKAGPRRQALQEMREGLMNPEEEPTPEELESYGVDEAVFDTLVGNTKDCIPTPVPKYLGNMQQTLFNNLADQMDGFRENMDRLNSSDSENQLIDVSSLELPSDRDISLAIRAFKDRNGTKRSPVGLAKALRHLLQDIGVPLGACGEFSFNALMACCRTPKEARRVMDLMKKQNEQPTSYTWSILSDVYAKVGDYQGCMDVHEEMLAAGFPPNLASYTSLFAACYKVCSDNRRPHKNRAEAADVAWKQWKNMFIVGIEPDAMAYGAILRITAIKGLPERALDIIEEMRTMRVTPTTLCFTSALRAVARGHETAIRHERGFSRKNMRRENIAAHYGKVAKSILIYAEDAGVEQDDGFVAALISCAAAAGDLATAKAIFLASQIRRLDQFRTIGSNRHLARLDGEVDMDGILAAGKNVSNAQNSNLPATTKSYEMTSAEKHAAHVKEFGEREYGKDSRVHSALLKACANSAGQNGIGTMWQGRENEGYLCENSLRLLKARPVPLYQNRDVPGEDDITEAFDNEYDVHDPGYRDGKRMGRKSGNKPRGIVPAEGHVATVDELGQQLMPLALEDDGNLRPEFRVTTPEDIWRKKYGENEGVLRAVRASKGFLDALEPEDALSEIADGSDSPKVEQISQTEENLPALEEPKEEMYFSYDTMKWEKGPRPNLAKAPANNDGSAKDTKSAGASLQNKEEDGELFFSYDTMKWETRRSKDTEKDSSKEEKQYFDNDTMTWKDQTRKGPLADAKIERGLDDNDTQPELVNDEPKKAAKKSPLVTDDNDETAAADDVFGDDFDRFYSELQREIDESGSPMGKINKEEAKDFFSSTKAINAAGQNTQTTEITFHDGDATSDGNNVQQAAVGNSPAHTSAPANSSMSSPTAVGTIELHPEAPRYDSPVVAEAILGNDEIARPDGDSTTDVLAAYAAEDAAVGEATRDENDGDQKKYDSDLEELREILPMLPERRLKKILQVFYKELESPHLTDLVLTVREVMPDYITNTWLKKMSRLTADYVMADADSKGLVGLHFLNAVVELKASLGGLDDAERFYSEEFTARNIEPSDYSDRLMIQMFLKQKRFGRAMKFKERVQSNTRAIDLLTYGSLLDYCAKRDQLGTALLLLKECVKVHGAPPGEATLRKMRVLLRRHRIDEDPEILEMIGEDPLGWLHRGQAMLKRERSKKGNRDINLPRSLMLKA